MAEDLVRKQEAARSGIHPNEGGLIGREIEGIADRLSVARHADLHRDHSVSLYDARPGRNPFAITQDIAERGKNAVRAEIGRATSELQSLMRTSNAVFCLKKKK